MTILSRQIASVGKTLKLLRCQSPASTGPITRVNIARGFSTTKQIGVDASGFDTVGCVGLGLMGHGICQVAATSGVHSKIVAFEQEQRFLDSGYV